MCIRDRYNYYQGSQDIEIVGRIAMLLFIVTLACDTAFVSLKEIDTGRRAALYRELAEKDLLTGCYNRNAYHEDTSPVSYTHLDVYKRQDLPLMP